MSEYFTLPTAIPPGTLAKSSDVNAITNAVETAFGSLSPGLRGSGSLTNEYPSLADRLANMDRQIAAIDGFKGPWELLAGAIDMPTSVYHAGKNWRLLQSLTDITSVEPGTNSNVWFEIGVVRVSENVHDIGVLTGGSYVVDIENGPVQSVIISAAEQTFTFDNPSATGTNTSFVLFITNGGSQVANWPCKWVGGEVPALTAAGLDILVFTTNDAGTNWYGFVAGLDVK